MIEAEPSGIKSPDKSPGHTMNVGTTDVKRTTISVLVIGVLLFASLWTMHAFIGPPVWATAIGIAPWPMLKWVESRVGGSRVWATTVMSFVMIVIFIVPFWAAIGVML